MEKDKGVKFCMHVGLVSRQVFSPFGELWLAGNHGSSGITSGMNGSGRSCALERGMGSELGAAALLKAVWWDLHLASLLTHSLFLLSVGL